MSEIVSANAGTRRPLIHKNMVTGVVRRRVANIASKLFRNRSKIGARNRSKMGRKRLQNGSLEVSGRPWESLGHPGGPKTDFSAILGFILGPICDTKIVPKCIEIEAEIQVRF